MAPPPYAKETRSESMAQFDEPTQGDGEEEEPDIPQLDKIAVIMVALGEEISIRGVRLRVVGFFDVSVRAIRDLDGEPILPEYQINLTPGAEIPMIESRTCQPTMVVITTVNSSLEIPRVLRSRVDVLLGEGVEPTLIGKGMALTREYRFWISSGEGIYLAYMGSQVAGKGLPLFVPWFIVVLNVVATMVNSMHERRREIGVFMSLGADDMYVYRMFLFESVILGLVGGVLGAGLGLSSSMLLGPFILSSPISLGDVPTFIVPLAVALSVIACVVSSLYPTWRATKIDPVSALKAV